MMHSLMGCRLVQNLALGQRLSQSFHGIAMLIDLIAKSKHFKVCKPKQVMKSVVVNFGSP